MVERKQVHILFLMIKYLYITYHEMSLPFLLQAVDVHRKVFVSVVAGKAIWDSSIFIHTNDRICIQIRSEFEIKYSSRLSRQQLFFRNPPPLFFYPQRIIKLIFGIHFLALSFLRRDISVSRFWEKGV